MKMKNIGFFEAHFEKFLVGAALLVIAVSIYYFTFSNPNQIELNSQPVGPSEVDSVVYNEAQRLQAQLSSDHVADPLKSLKVPDYTANFVGKLGQPATPVTEFPIALGNTPMNAGGTPPPITQDKPFFQPEIPTPTVIAQAADMGAINDAEVESIPELKTIVGEQPPYDTAWVSVVGQFSMQDMLKQLTQEEDDTHRMIPPEWWKTTFAIVDVQMARQQQNADGTWPADDKFEVVASLPGKLSFRGVPRDPTPQQASEYLKLINQYRGVVIQQPFYELANDRVWVAPEPVDETAVVASGDTQEQIKELERQMRLKMARVKIIEQQITRLKAPRGGNRPAGGARPGGGGLEGLEGVSGEFGEFGPSAPSRPTTRSSGANSILERRVQRLNEQADKIKLELNELQAQHKALMTGEDPTKATPAGRRTTATRRGATPYGGEFGEFGEFGAEFMGEFGEFGPGGPAGGAAAPRRTSDAAVNILGTETVDLWATDLGVEPGKTYRYKMRVTVVNVLFRKPGLPEAQQKFNDDKFLVDSDWSDWSKPVSIEKVQHFFVMSASPQPEPGQATFEIWKFFNGQWFRNEFSVHPGDPIGGKTTVTDATTGQKIEVDFATGTYLVDIDFNYIVQARLGNLPHKTQMLMFIQDGQLKHRRVDVDKDDPMRRELQDKQRSGIAAASSLGR